MTLSKRLYYLLYYLRFDDLQIQARRDAAHLLLKYVGEATGHTGTDVATGGTEHHHHATGHVLERVVTSALNHCLTFRVAHREPLAAPAVCQEKKQEKKTASKGKALLRPHTLVA